MRVDEIVAAWSTAASRGNAAELGELMSSDVVLVSPITDQFVFSGRDEVVGLLGHVFDIVSDVTITRALHDEDTAMLVVTAVIRGRALQEVVLLDISDGLVTQCTFFMRPLPVLTALLRALGPAVTAARGQKGLSVFMKVAGAFPDLVVSQGDRYVMPLAAPPTNP